MRVLVISAHPDDETIGVGGTLLRYVAEGHEVFWCIVTQGYSPPWTPKSLEAAQIQINSVSQMMGFKQVFRLGFPTVKLNTVSYIELSSALQKVVDEVKPEVVYTTPRHDINQDHRIVFDCTLVATRPLPGCSVRRLLSYEISPTTRFGLPSGGESFTPNVYVDISDFLEKKIQIMSLYETELREYPHPRSLDGLRLLAQERGFGVGLRAAECFELIRELM